MVVKRGTNEASIVPMARHFKGSGHIVRYIEYMDVGRDQRLANGRRRLRRRDRADDRCGAARSRASIPTYTGEVAERWRYRDGSGEIGVIASVTRAFCRDCTRARLSTDGKLYTCLFATEGYDLRALLREGAGDEPIGNAVAAIWRARADRYSEIRTGHTVQGAEGRDELHRWMTPPRRMPGRRPATREPRGHVPAAPHRCGAARHLHRKRRRRETAPRATRRSPASIRSRSTSTSTSSSR
jgi:molybdenum cofactor biosynthesis enzyme MoaA